MTRNRSLGLLLLLFFVSFGRPYTAGGSELVISSEEQLRLSEEAMQKGEYQRAIVELERFLHYFPRDEMAPKVRYLIGLAYLKSKQYEKARDVLEEVVTTYPGTSVSGEALFLYAESYYMQGLYEEAEKIYRQIILESPDSRLKNRAVYRLGWSLMQRGRWKEASGEFQDVSQDSPLFPSSRELSRRSLQGEQLPSKDPTTAGILSAVLPGLGHAYSNRYKDGLVAFLLNGLFIFAAYESFDNDLEVLGSMLAFLELGWYSGSIYSAVNSAHKYNRAVKNHFLQNLKDGTDIGFYTTREGHVGLAFQVHF